MARRVKPGERLNITAAEYNRLLAAADAVVRDRLSGGAGNRTHVRDAATVRVHYQSDRNRGQTWDSGLRSPLVAGRLALVFVEFSIGGVR